jgi:hypothetical protein
MKRFTILAIAALTTMSIAQQAGGPPPIAVTHGKGVAGSEDKRIAEFDFEVAKFKNKEGKEEVRGRFHMTQKPGENIPGAMIGIRMVGGLGVNDNKAEFGGKAVVEVRTKDGVKRIEGMASVNVVDQVRPNEQGSEKKDLIRVQFKSKNGEVTYEFKGAVRRGDLVVRKGRPGGGDGGGGGAAQSGSGN